MDPRSQALTNFLQPINSFHPTIKISHQQSYTSINFLDTTIQLTEQRTLQSTLYTKPTDKGRLLFHSSHHRQALPYGRIITNNHELHKHLRRLHKILLARGYSHSTITTAFNKVTSHTQSQLLQPKTSPVTNGIHLPFIIPTTPVFRLKDMLVHSRFSTHNCKTKFSTATNLNTTSTQHNTTQHNTTHQPHQLIPKQSNTRANPHAVEEQKAIYLHKPSYPQQEPESLRPQSNHNHKDQ